MIVVLLSVSLTGCMGIQTGEEVGPLEQTNEQAPNATGTEDAQDDGQAATEDGGTNGTAAEDAGDDQRTDDPANGTDDDATEDETTTSEDEEPASPWTRNGTLELGWMAAAGANFTGQAPNASAQGERGAEHCPDARLVVPQGASHLTISSTAEPANASAPEDPGNATPPGAGLYTLYIQTADGEEIYLSGGDAAASDRSDLVHETDEPAPGAWTLEMRPMGPVVAQTWTVDAGLSGTTVDAPGPLTYETLC